MPVALPGPHQPEVGDDRLLEDVLRARRSLEDWVSFGGRATRSRCRASSYRHGRPPSATWVPPPVAVKNAAIPEPPARIRSASVPCGVSSTSSSPERYCRANSLFSPTYDATIRRNRFSAEQPAQAPVVDAAVVRDRLEVGRPGLQDRLDQHRRDPAQPESTHRQRRAVGDVGDRLGRTCHNLVHEHTSVPRSCHDGCARGHPRTRPSRGYPRSHACPARRVRTGLPRRAAAHRHRQGRHREVDRRGRARAGPRLPRQDRAALRGRGPPGHRPALRRPPAALRGAPRGPRHHRRRRRLRAGDRRRVGAAGVPRHVLPPRSRREGARPVRRHRVRHHHRPGRARRAADRQGLRGRQPQPPQQGRPGVRRDRARRPAHRSDRPVPQRQHRARRAGQGRADQVAGRRGDEAAPLQPYGDPPGHRAGGDAGAGDRRRDRRAARRQAARSAGSSSTWSARRTSTPTSAPA